VPIRFISSLLRARSPHCIWAGSYQFIGSKIRILKQGHSFQPSCRCVDYPSNVGAPPLEVNTHPKDTTTPVIRCAGLTRVFRTYKKEPGFAGALRGLVRRHYDDTYAARNVTFEVQEGEFVGFLGPNGAGKTTTLKMLSGLLHPTSGEASVLSYVPWERHHAYRRQFALLLGQKNQLWWDLPAIDSLELNARIYGLARSDFLRTVDELTGMLRVRDKLNVMVRELSLGERMKMELIAALLHHPKVLFLDEPTIGLDVVSQNIVREFLRQHNRVCRTTVLLTSHYMADIESLCNRVIIMDHGSVFFDGKLEDVMNQFAAHKIVRLACSPQPALDDVPDNVRALAEVVLDDFARLQFKVRRESVAALCRALLDFYTVTDISIEDISAEEVIRQLFVHSHEGKLGCHLNNSPQRSSGIAAHINVARDLLAKKSA
jgi:viologen exporter family transport system ATP-binding protein